MNPISLTIFLYFVTLVLDLKTTQKSLMLKS